MKQLFSCDMETRMGTFQLLFHPKRGIYKVIFPDKASVLPFLRADFPWTGLQPDLDSYLGGEQINFAYPLDLNGCSLFTREVLKVVSRISYGEVLSYRDVAVRAGLPLACRAVGRVMATNRFPILIPCHRVIKANGNQGGFSAGDGWKKYLLDLENAGKTIVAHRNMQG